MTHVQPLARDEVRSVIQGSSIAGRVPFYIHFWVHPETFGEREAEVRKLLDRYPEDIQLVRFNMPRMFREEGGASAGYSWLPHEAPMHRTATAHDATVNLPDWGLLEEMLARFPDFRSPLLFGRAVAPDGRYRLAQWFFCLFERHWELRGMANALTDYYLHPEQVHRLFRALTDFYVGIIGRAAREQRCDGIWTSDDLGTQRGPFFSTGIFNEFFLPYYAEMIYCAHSLGMEFWMHACGDVKPFIPGWVEAGLDVLHPIQKHTMDEAAIARRFGDKLTIFAGLDVQQVIPWGTPERVREEVRYLLDTYWRPGVGRCMLTAGNGINQDCSLESLEAFLDEALVHGSALGQADRRGKDSKVRSGL